MNRVLQRTLGTTHHSNSHFLLRVVLIALIAACLVFAFTSGANGEDSPAVKNPPTATKPDFDKVGPQVGEQLPELRLRTLKGEAQNLGDAWHGGPALLVTSSFTCPKSRSRWPELSAIAKKYDGKLNVAIVYVIEAHPVGSVCPYKGIEDITPENQRDGILRKQPATLDDRLELAQDFKRYLRIDQPIYVDPLDNRAWKAFGAAPNIAFVVDENGIVLARQGWFDGPSLEKLIEEGLTSFRKRKQNEKALADAALNINNEVLDNANLKSWDLVEPIAQNDLVKLHTLIKKAPDGANQVLRSGRFTTTTWLMAAISQKNVGASKALLESGANVRANCIGDSHDSALQLAAEIGQPEMVKLLLTFRPDLDFPLAKSPLHESLVNGHADVARILIAAGAKSDLYSDIGLGYLDAVRSALKEDPSRALRPDGAGRSPLDYAAANGQLEMARFLLDQGALVADSEMSRKQVALHFAIQFSKASMVELLLEAGNSPNTAVGFRSEGMFAGAGSSVQMTIAEGESRPALHMAIDRGDIEIVKALLKFKPELEARNTYSQTSLHYAANLGKAEIAELLIKAGADVKATTLGFNLPCGSLDDLFPKHNTPLHFAAACGNPATIKVLLAAGANINIANEEGLTPLMFALAPSNYLAAHHESLLKNIETLIEAGANVNAQDKTGRTSLDLAKCERDDDDRLPPEVVMLLIKHGAKGSEPPKDSYNPQRANTPPRKKRESLFDRGGAPHVRHRLEQARKQLSA